MNEDCQNRSQLLANTETEARQLERTLHALDQIDTDGSWQQAAAVVHRVRGMAQAELDEARRREDALSV